MSDYWVGVGYTEGTGYSASTPSEGRAHGTARPHWDSTHENATDDSTSMGVFIGQGRAYLLDVEVRNAS